MSKPNDESHLSLDNGLSELERTSFAEGAFTKGRGLECQNSLSAALRWYQRALSLKPNCTKYFDSVKRFKENIGK